MGHALLKEVIKFHFFPSPFTMTITMAIGMDFAIALLVVPDIDEEYAQTIEALSLMVEIGQP
jgi:hypothetical protein